MKLESIVAITIQPTELEKAAGKDICEHLHGLIEVLGEGKDIVNTYTGEVIEIKELARVCGIIDGLMNPECTCWEVVKGAE